MRPPIAGLLAVTLLAGCVSASSKLVKGAWVRLPAVAGRPGAAYFELAAAQRPLTLLSVRTPAAIRTELHETMKTAGGAMSMAPLKQVTVPANASVAFAPGGKHVMLFDVNPKLKAGDTTTLTLAFADGSTMETPAKVRGAGDPAP